MQGKIGNREHTNSYIWSRFKYSLLTLTGVLLPSISSIAMMLKDWPVNLQLFNILALVAMVGGSYWWHWFYNVEELAQISAKKYMDMQTMKRKQSVKHRYDSIDFSLDSKYNLLHKRLKKGFNSFQDVLKNQKVITNFSKKSFQKKSEQAFNSAIDILAEISDILVVQESINISEISKSIDKNPTQKVLLQKIESAYNENENNLKKLTQTLEEIIDSFTLAISHLATVTSKTNLKEETFNASLLQNAINSAKIVQEKVASLSKNREAEINDIYNKYLNKGE